MPGRSAPWWPAALVIALVIALVAAVPIFVIIWFWP